MGTGGNNIPCIALAGNTIGRQPQNDGNGNVFDESGVSYMLTRTDVHAVSAGTTIRKLTPTECERLQGFPDGWTKITYRGKSAEECPDSPRYKAIGNSMCTNVMKWIGERLSAYLTSQ
ncbi:TPA: DNA cytosine methyltransferase [Mannheimia haemolytica]|nr:DNA cytosine methyltransferase [Mannheimia haemolytica]HDL5357350.1 DNA cytosine methyltransferase [Mannheimia haemolytica]HDZ6740820.1 DNA cytosine methyltransferase [Mannheimia haemolytica]